MVGIRCAVFNHVCTNSLVLNFLCPAFLYLKTDFSASGQVVKMPVRNPRRTT